MTCVPMDRLLQSLKVYVPGVTDPMLSVVLFNTMDEFFRRTSAWRWQVDIVLKEDQYEYVFAIPPDTEVVRSIAVSQGEIPVPATAQAGAVLQGQSVIPSDQVMSDGDSLFNADESDINPETSIFSYAIYHPSTLTVTLPPDQGTETPLKAILALTVAKTCLEQDCGDWQLEDWMYDMFFHEFLDGALSRLYLMPTKPWTSKEQGVYHGKRFRNAMALRKQEANKGFTYGVPGWRFPTAGGWV